MCEEVCASLILVLPVTSERHGPAGQGYCQGGFSADFTKVRTRTKNTLCVWSLLDLLMSI